MSNSTFDEEKWQEKLKQSAVEAEVLSAVILDYYERHPNDDKNSLNEKIEKIFGYTYMEKIRRHSGSEVILETFLQDHYHHLEDIASNSNAPAVILDAIARDKYSLDAYHYAKTKVAYNPATSKETLIYLSKKRDNEVRSAASYALDRRVS